MRFLHSKIFYIVILLIIVDIVLVCLFIKKDDTNTNISTNFFVVGNSENNGCLSIYVDDPDNNEYSFDNGLTWQKSKYGAIYQNGTTTILVKDSNSKIIYRKSFDINNIVSNAPVINIDFDSSVNNKSEEELLRGVTAISNGKDISSNLEASIIEEKNNRLLVAYLIEDNGKKCYLLRDSENKNIEIKKEEQPVSPQPKSVWGWPTDRPYQISRGVSSKHNGVDIYGPARGTPILAARDGEVTNISVNSSSGYYVTIKHDEGYYTRYAHMQNTNGNDRLNGTSSATRYISVGDYVKKGDIIGELGSSGNSTGPHIHFEIWSGVPFHGKVLNPLLYYTKGVNR